MLFAMWPEHISSIIFAPLAEFAHIDLRCFSAFPATCLLAVHLGILRSMCVRVREWNCVAAVLSVLHCHGESHVAVAEQGLLAIRSLACNNAANNARLGEGGACAGGWVAVLVS